MTNHFKVIIPVRNAEEYITRCLYSVWAQTYANWSIIIVDDNSSDDTVSEIKRFINKFDTVKDKITVVQNDDQCYALSNMLTAISMSSDNDIICHVDGDDWLCDMDAFTLINEQYNHPSSEVAAVWTNQRWGFTLNGNSLPMAQDVDVYRHDWVASHLKTFRKYLINDVDMENFYDPNGKYFQRIADQAIYLPILKRCQDLGLAYAYLPIFAYHYNINHTETDFSSPDAILQNAEATYLRNRGYIE